MCVCVASAPCGGDSKTAETRGVGKKRNEHTHTQGDVHAQVCRRPSRACPTCRFWGRNDDAAPSRASPGARHPPRAHLALPRTPLRLARTDEDQMKMLTAEEQHARLSRDGLAAIKHDEVSREDRERSGRGKPQDLGDGAQGS